MSYLEDPRVFLATERTLLAYIRTEISILAIAFILKKFMADDSFSTPEKLESIIYTLCGMTILLSILSFIQAGISISRMSAKEIPGPLAKPLVYLSGLLSVIISIGAAYLVY